MADAAIGRHGHPRAPALMGAALAIGIVVSVGATRPSAASAPRSPHAFGVKCVLYARDAAYRQVSPPRTVRLSPRAQRAVEALGQFRFRARLWLADGRPGALTTEVSQRKPPRTLTREVFQFNSDVEPGNQFGGGHGFTGLRYTNSARGEFQHYCNRSAAP